MKIEVRIKGAQGEGKSLVAQRMTEQLLTTIFDEDTVHRIDVVTETEGGETVAEYALIYDPDGPVVSKLTPTQEAEEAINASQD